MNETIFNEIRTSAFNDEIEKLSANWLQKTISSGVKAGKAGLAMAEKHAPQTTGAIRKAVATDVGAAKKRVTKAAVEGVESIPGKIKGYVQGMSKSDSPIKRSVAGSVSGFLKTRSADIARRKKQIQGLAS